MRKYKEGAFDCLSPDRGDISRRKKGIKPTAGNSA
jgi:hypothetical protein